MLDPGDAAASLLKESLYSLKVIVTVPPPYRHLSTEIATSFKLVSLTTKTEAVTWLNNRIHSSTTKLRPPAPSPTLLSTHSVKVKVAQLCPTLCNPMYYTVHGILQARIQEWAAFPFSRGSSQPKDRTQVSQIAGGFFTSWASREVQEYRPGSLFPSQVDLPSPGIELVHLHCKWTN